MAKDKNLKGGLDGGNGTEPGLEHLRPKKGGKPRSAPAAIDPAVLEQAKSARDERRRQEEQWVAAVTEGMQRCVPVVVQAFLDETQRDVSVFEAYQQWIDETLLGQEGKVGQAAWLTMYEATFGRKMYSHQELDQLLKWLVGLKRLVYKGKASKGPKPKKSQPRSGLYHFGVNYDIPTKAGFTATQARKALTAFNAARDKIWEVVDKAWAEAPAEMAAKATISLDQFLDGNSGVFYLDIPAVWNKRKRRMDEGGPLLGESDGKFVRVIEVSNELGHMDHGRRVKAWGNFEHWMDSNAIAHAASQDEEAFPGVEVPLHMITIHPPDEDEFYEEPIYSRNKTCWRIRDGIRAVKNPPRPKAAKPKPVAEPAKAEPKEVKKNAKKPRVRKPRAKKAVVAK